MASAGTCPLPGVIERGDRLELEVVVQPRSARTRIVGVHGDRIKIALQAPPVDGKANEALIEFLVEFFEVAKGQVILERGAHSRQKTVSVPGHAGGSLQRLLDALHISG